MRCLILGSILNSFHSLQRGADGKFDDAKLAEILKNQFVVPSDNCGRAADNAAELSIQPHALGPVGHPIS